MTNKSLSQQICEACGIEPKYQCSYHSCTCPIQDIGKFNPKCPKQIVTRECDARSNKPCYPDFENNNNNFVTLMSMLHCSSLLSYLNFNSFAPLKNCVLKGVLKILKNRTEYFTSESLIKFIKNEEWEV